MTTTLSITEYNITAERVAKINARAAKRGFTGRFTLTAENQRKVEVTRATDGSFLLFSKFVEVVDVTLSGEAPKFEGWTFLARIDVEGDTFTLATAPGVDQIDRSLVRVGECDHCHKNRARKNTYLVQGEDGSILNVGATCIKDFLGHDVRFAFIDEKSVEDEAFGDFGGVHNTEHFKVADVLALAIASTRQRGFTPTSAYGVSTKDHVLNVVGTFRRLTDVEEAAARTLAAAAKEISAEDVAKVIDFINSEEFTGSTYTDNLKAIVSQEFVTLRNIGLLVSAPNALARHLGQVAERAAKVASEWIGTEGAKITTTIKVESIRTIENNYGYNTTTSLLILGRTEAGEIVKTFTTAAWAWDVEEGQTITLTATVKAHDTYHDVKQTQVVRPKQIA